LAGSGAAIWSLIYYCRLQIRSYTAVVNGRDYVVLIKVSE
jgi:hypothetical protein